MTIRFDDSLPALVSVIEAGFGGAALAGGVAVRDITGRLAFVLPTEFDAELVERIGKLLQEALGPYARSDRLLVASTDFGAEALLKATSALSVKVNDQTIRLIDRRLVGADWLRAPAEKALPPPRFVFASLKGGVGRSTALAITAAHLASAGKRVLAIDLDMEAPGLGSLLLDDGTLPEFGLIDALVENGLAPLDETFLADLVGPSDLADRHGRIDVIPAFGRRSMKNPGDVLSKIARAYTEDIRPDGSVASILDQISELIDRFADPTRYDAILVDARAGLHETTATAILGLGAEVFLFGLDERQTFQGYAALLGHLGRFANPLADEIPEWLGRLSMVQGKAPADANARDAFADKCKQLFIDSGLENIGLPPIMKPRPAAGSFSDVPWDDDQKDEDVLPKELRVFRDPVAILNNEQFMQFDPRQKRNLLSAEVYRSSYGMFLDRVNESFPDSKMIDYVAN
ncbi:ParA family protein [Polaromonas sp.]|uniref:ParA family protein n=1 Tax=Polaromonas sp. TaxID=1869339 RepID=UPI003BB7E40E